MGQLLDVRSQADWLRKPDETEDVLKSIVDLIKGPPPGPPPRIGLVWHEETSRWRRSEEVESDEVNKPPRPGLVWHDAAMRWLRPTDIDHGTDWISTDQLSSKFPASVVQSLKALNVITSEDQLTPEQKIAWTDFAGNSLLDDGAKGIYDDKTQSMFIMPGNSDRKPTYELEPVIPNYTTDTLNHEFGHHIWFTQLNDSQRQAWEDLWREERHIMAAGPFDPKGKFGPNMPTNYASMNPAEYFADIVMSAVSDEPEHQEWFENTPTASKLLRDHLPWLS